MFSIGITGTHREGFAIVRVGDCITKLIAVRIALYVFADLFQVSALTSSVLGR
jgi:hypothetical protein